MVFSAGVSSVSSSVIESCRTAVTATSLAAATHFSSDGPNADSGIRDVHRRFDAVEARMDGRSDAVAAADPGKTQPSLVAATDPGKPWPSSSAGDMSAANDSRPPLFPTSWPMATADSQQQPEHLFQASSEAFPITGGKTQSSGREFAVSDTRSHCGHRPDEVRSLSTMSPATVSDVGNTGDHTSGVGSSTSLTYNAVKREPSLTATALAASTSHVCTQNCIAR